MGAFKPLLPFGNTSVVRSCVGYLRAGGVSDVIVVAGHRSEEIRQHLAGEGVTLVLNPDVESEMGASVRYGVNALSRTNGAAVVALVDHPAVPAYVVSRLIDEWQHGARLIIPTTRGRGGHPVLVDASFRQELAMLDNRGLKGFFQDYRSDVLRVEVDSPYIARDMDTWDDYRALHHDLFGVEPARAWE
jgi:molybdenum cofactor cytidylyltransferase